MSALILPYQDDGPKAQAIVAAWYRYLSEQNDSVRDFNARKARVLRQLREARFRQHWKEEEADG
jgi:hypothetical protein